MNSRIQSSTALLALTLGIPALLSAACATVPVVEEEPPPPASGRRPAFDAAGFAAQYSRPVECERAARELQFNSRDVAWAALKACIAKGNFLLLQQLASPAWARDLKTRPDAPVLLAQVIAMRGGDLSADLQMLHSQQIPLFTLSDGIVQPDLYTGRYVVFRGRVDDMRAEGGSYTAKVQELALQSEAFDSQVGLARRTVSEDRGAGSIQGRITPLGAGAGSGSFGKSSDRTSFRTARRYDNVTVETGREALVRLPEADPFLEPGKEFIVLARFDGVRTTSSNADEEEPEVVPVLTLISFHAPNPLVIH